MRMIQAAFIGLAVGVPAAMILLLAGTTEMGGYTTNPSLLHYGILVTGACIMAIAKSREVTAVLTASLLPAVLIALLAETCEFSTDVLKPCVEVYSTRQNLTYSATYLLVGLMIGVAFRVWRERLHPELHRVG